MTLVRRHQAPALPARVLTGLTLLFASLSVLRGYGWATAVPGETVSLVAQAALVDTLSRGLAVGAAGLLVLVAYAVRIHLLVWLAHGLAAVTYASLTVSFMTAAADYGGGWQHVAPMLGGVAWHGLLAWLTGPLPPSRTGAERDTDKP